MEVFFTADTHFFHPNIIKHCDRPFKKKNKLDIDAMHEHFIEEWNKVVGLRDKVFHLGDFSLGNFEDSLKVFQKLEGRVNFIVGNHDNQKFQLTDLCKRGRGPEVYTRLEFKYNKQFVVLDHYSLRTWNRRRRGSWMLYGHSHNNLPSEGLTLDVGVDSAAALGYGYRPLHWDEVKQILDEQDG